jgi:hypothetical protein
MGKALRLAAVLGGAILCAATWNSDVAAQVDSDAVDVTSSTSISEPVTGTPLDSAAPAGIALKDPFGPYGIGPIGEAVPHDALTREEKEVADRGRDTGSSSAVHNAYGAAVVARSKQARADAAQHQLGIDSLDTTGVIQ